MNKTIQSNLCKGLRACGIPQEQTHQLLNIFEKWYRENGPEWCNSRIKDLRQWYETTLTGCPKPPVWFRHSKEGYPLGIWKWVFKLPKAKALGVLSMNTVLYEEQLSRSQKKKFLHGLEGNRTQNPAYLDSLLAKVERLNVNKMKVMPKIKFPTLFDMTGSIPVQEGRSTMRPDQKLGLALSALRSSWESIPQVTFDFLVNQDLLAYMPQDVLGNKYQLELQRPHDRCVGRVSVLQQPQLKARIVGNPNRILQVTLEPLKSLYMETARKLPTDVTHDQESGVMWVQNQLRLGNELAGSDLTSASDLLDVELCLKLCDSVYGFSSIKGYKDYRDYFFEVSRADWFCPSLKCNVKWKQGDVLGTGPSFGLLTLTNNASAWLAYKEAKEDGYPLPHYYDCFRVVGDDIVMRSQLEPYYTRIIESLGGEINHSKTLKSNRVAEFAGRVITSNSSYLKAVKYSEPSDNSFMSYVAQLGDQAKYLLKPKQRQAYNLFKEVPGVLVSGPWMPDSYGISLSARYSWYLQEVEPRLSRVEPDLSLTDYEFLLLKAELSLAEVGNATSEFEFDNPLIDEGYLPSQVTPTFKVGGDPRLTNGKSQLDVLYQHVLLKDVLSFRDWMDSENRTSSNMGSSVSKSPTTSNLEVLMQKRASGAGFLLPSEMNSHSWKDDIIYLESLEQDKAQETMDQVDLDEQ